MQAVASSIRHSQHERSRRTFTASSKGFETSKTFSLSTNTIPASLLFLFVLVIVCVYVMKLSDDDINLVWVFG